MHFLKDLCCICLKHQDYLQRLSNYDKSINYYSRLVLLFPEMVSTELCYHGSICTKCCSKVDDFFKFREKCLQNCQIYLLKLSSVSETSEDLCIDLIESKEERKQFIKNCKEQEKSSNNPLIKCDKRNLLPNEMQKFDNDSCTVTTCKEKNADYTDFHEFMHNSDDGTKKGITDDNYDNADSNTDIEKIYIKSEPADTNEFENELESPVVTESYGVSETYTSSTEDMPQDSNSSNIINTEKIYLKAECVDDGEYEKSAIEQDIDETLISKTKKQIKKKLLKCEHCNKVFSRFKHFKRHQLVHNGEKQYKCEQCNKAFSLRNYLTRHQLVHSGEKPFQCAKPVLLKTNLIKHKLLHTGEKPFKCEQCGKAFSVKERLIKHKLVHSGEKPFKCDQCDKAFSLKENLIKHKLLHSDAKPFKCDVCNIAFTHSIQLERHQQVHTGVKPYTCEECNKAFSQKEYLARHKLTHTGIKPYKCEECYKLFSQLSNLLTHQRVHTGEKPFKCDQCDKAFSLKKSVSRHKRIHTEQILYPCDKCDKVFSLKGSLIRHQLLHTGEKPFKCDQCERVFTEKGTLIRHKRVHTGEKPFKCELCNKAFTRKGTLTKHREMHTGVM